MAFNPSLINVDASHYSGDKFTSTVNPNSVNVNAMPLPGSNVQSAALINYILRILRMSLNM